MSLCVCLFSLVLPSMEFFPTAPLGMVSRNGPGSFSFYLYLAVFLSLFTSSVGFVVLDLINFLAIFRYLEREMILHLF